MTLANGHGRPVTLAPLALPERGTAQPWPQQDDPERSRTAADGPGRWRHAISARRVWLAAIPVILVNSVAFCGQLAFLRGHLPWPLAGQVLVAVTLESVAVYLAWQAHLALVAHDSALRLRLAAYAFAAVIGVMNYSHYLAAGWRPTFAAVTFGLMSLSSPWLWSVHSRRTSRDALRAAEQLEAHAVRLGVTRWAWHPVRSCRVMFRATWLGVTKPADAIALLDDAVEAVTPPVTPARPPVRPRPKTSRDDRQLSEIDRARAVIRDNPGLKNAELAALAGCKVRTVQRARNGTAKQ